MASVDLTSLPESFTQELYSILNESPATTLNSLEEGFRTVLIDDACRGIDNDSIAQTKNAVEIKGGMVLQSSEVPDLVKAKDRRPEMGCSTMLYVLSEREGLGL